MAERMPKHKIKDREQKIFLTQYHFLDEIWDCVPTLSLDELKEIEAEVMQMV